MEHGTLHNEDILREGYWPKMLLYALDELFYVFDQVKWQRGTDEKLIVAYEILCLSTLRCTERRHGYEKKGVPDALSLLNVNDACHLERLTWVVYDGALLVGKWPELPGNCQWCTVLAGLYKHIYRGHDDAAHCPPYTLASWDCQERTKALHQEGKLGSAQSGSRMPALRDWSRHSCCSPPNMPLRCHCWEPSSPGADTIPKLASAVNVPSYAQSSCSGRGMARAFLDEEDAWEDDFQTLHMLVHHVVQHDGGGRREPATERMEPAEGSPGWQSYFQVDVGKEEVEMLESIDPQWRATHWLQMAVQGIAEEEVPWCELITPLTSGAEGAALSLAKCLLAAWRWSMKVCGEDTCPPTPTVLDIRQFMTEEETAGGMGEPHSFVAYSCALQLVGKAACRQKWKWPTRETLQVKVSPLVRAFWEETGTDLTMACIKLCWEPAPRAIYCKRENSPTAHVITFLDELVVWVPTLDTWDQLVWLPTAAVPQALTEAELYGYCRGQVVDLGPMMPATQFQVTEEGGAYLCVARGLVFKGSVLAYNPAMNEVEWIPVHGLANDLTWAEERSAMALANYVPHTPVEAAQIAWPGAHQIVSCPDSSSSEEDKAQHPELQTTDTEHKWEEREDGARRTDPEEEAEPDR